MIFFHSVNSVNRENTEVIKLKSGITYLTTWNMFLPLGRCVLPLLSTYSHRGDEESTFYCYYLEMYLLSVPGVPGSDTSFRFGEFNEISESHSRYVLGVFLQIDTFSKNNFRV